MSSGNEMRDIVKDVLKDIVVPKLNYPINKIPNSVLNGLINITIENETSDIFTQQTIECMGNWVKDVYFLNFFFR